MKSLPLLFVGTFLLPSQAFANANYDSLQQRLLKGERLTSILALKNCSPNSKEKDKLAGRELIGGLAINSFMIMSEPNPAIAYSHKHFTSKPDGSQIEEIIQYRIFPDGSTKIKISKLSARTLEPLSPPSEYSCLFGQGLRIVPEKSSEGISVQP